jgi:hypothetical protein
MAELSFDQRIAVIIGTGCGIGRAHAILLAVRGGRAIAYGFFPPPCGEGKGGGVSRFCYSAWQNRWKTEIKHTPTPTPPHKGEGLLAESGCPARDGREP